ncbi:MAG: hypothetical protein R2881_07470 [Eubacteriales bacterium]
MKLAISELGHLQQHSAQRGGRAGGPEGRKNRGTRSLISGTAFTVGRPHPMIDPSLRAERVITDAKDPSCAVIMADCVIGFGSHPSPAEDPLPRQNGRTVLPSEGRHLCCVCGLRYEGDRRA